MKCTSILMFLFVILLAVPAYADGHGEWLCEQTSSTRSGNTFLACGMGEGTDEGQARKAALHDAFREFEDICSMSSDCDGHPRTVEPQRTTCKRDPRGFVQCFRLVVVTLGK